MTNVSTMQAELDCLETKRRVLSFQVGQGNEIAEIDLDQIEDQIGRLRRDIERAALAAEEAKLRAQAEAAQEREEEAVRQAAKLRALLGSRTIAAGEVEAAADALCEAITRYSEIGKQAYVLSGGQRSTLGQRQLEAFLTWKFGEVMPRFAGMPKPDHALRKPLTEALTGETEVA